MWNAWKLLLAVLAFAPAMAKGVIIETKGSGRRLGGYLVSMDKENNLVRVRFPLSGGKERIQEFNTKDYIVLIAVKPSRLEELNREKPKLYREYAEELEAVKDDPEAQEMALRLYLIAAYLEPEKLGPGCLKSASKLARSSEEARRFLAMAFLLDPKHNREILKPVAIASGAPSRDPLYDTMVIALHHFRRGRLSSALKLAQREGVAEEFENVPGLMSHNDFILACKDRTAQKAALTDEQLTIILRLELSYGNQGNKKSSDKWSTELLRKKPSPIRPLRLLELTEMDPRKCHFRQGKWVEP